MSFLAAISRITTDALLVPTEGLVREKLPETDSTERRKDYILGLKSWAEEDKKVVFLWIAFNLATVSLTLSEKIFDSGAVKSALVGIAMVSLLFSSLLFFVYYHELHMAARALNANLLDLDCEGALHKVRVSWQKCSRVFNAATIFLAIGVLGYLIQFALNVK